MTPPKTPADRPPLTRDQILRAAVALADRNGLDALTMRRLGAELGFEAMALYKHVANKEEILDGIVELVIGRIEIPSDGAEWREAMRQRARSAREVLGKHSWAIALIEARPRTGPATLRYLNAILGNLRAGGFSIEQAAHAFSLLDSYVYGQVIQETSSPFDASGAETEPPAPTVDETMTGEYPHLVAMYEHARTFGYSFEGEFEFGLDLILEGLERQRSTRRP